MKVEMKLTAVGGWGLEAKGGRDRGKTERRR